MNSLPFYLTVLQAFETALVLEDIFIDLFVEERVVCSLLCAREVLNTLESSTLHVRSRTGTLPLHSRVPSLPSQVKVFLFQIIKFK